MKRWAAAYVVAAAALLLSGCVTHIHTDITQNPPPLERFSDFNRFEMSRITLPLPDAASGSNAEALVKIQEYVDAKMVPALLGWNQNGAAAASRRTLVIDPSITQMKFVGGGRRFLTGSFSGSSAVILTARIWEKETNRTLATPVFYARAAAMGATWTFGTTDKLMLLRVANRLSDYLLANYGAAVGGPSGAKL